MQRASSVRATFGPDQAIMELDDILANRQPQTQTALLPRQSFIHPMEAIEDALKVFCGNTQPMIAHTELYHLPLFLSSRLHIRALDMAVIAYQQGLCFPIAP